MSETNQFGAHHNPERHEQHPEIEKQHKDVIEKAIEQGRHARHEHAEKLLHIQHEAKKEATPAQEQLAKHLEEEKPSEQLFINRELKDMSYKRTLQHVQKKLKAPERALSKVMHNEAVNAVSEVAGKTIARPSGILVGGIIACIGSSLFLWIAKHYGYEYNFLFFALLFAGGFVLGLLIELGYRFMKRRSTQS